MVVERDTEYAAAYARQRPALRREVIFYGCGVHGRITEYSRIGRYICFVTGEDYDVVLRRLLENPFRKSVEVNRPLSSVPHQQDWLSQECHVSSEPSQVQYQRA
jgi:hypothetical protein